VTNRPNIILIVSDDHGYGDRSALGAVDVSTPALDRLAAEGATMDEAYVTAPICSPSRSAIISGVHQARWGAKWFDSSRFPPEQVPTLAERLRDQGYRTGYFGKVHYGPEKPGDRACPPGHGFDESFYGLAGGQMGRLNYLHHSQQTVDEYGPVASTRMAVAPLFEGTEQVEYEGFLTAELGRRARDFVQRHHDEPFFAMVAFNAVHNFCWQLPDDELSKRGLPKHDDWTPAIGDYGEWYDDAIAPNLEHGRAYYLAQLELMDAEIGALLDSLDAAGLAEDTIVVYTTDNGGSTCNFGDNTPLRGTKYTLWEGGIRVPMLVRWPAGGVPGGVRRSGLFSTLDLVPTLTAAAGSTATGGDGHDQWELIRADSTSPHRHLYWTTGWSWAVRDGTWKLSWVDPDSSEAAAVARQQHAEIGSGLFLADLRQDPGETVNRAGDRADIVATLTEEFDRWSEEVSTVGSLG